MAYSYKITINAPPQIIDRVHKQTLSVQPGTYKVTVKSGVPHIRAIVINGVKIPAVGSTVLKLDRMNTIEVHMSGIFPRFIFGNGIATIELTPA